MHYTIEYKDIDGELHREDGPALICGNGTREWYEHGDLHREDGPAIERADGSREWWVKGRRHREDGPAIEYADGTYEWWVCDRLHRDGGPAIERADGDLEYWQDDRLHREDGPALEYADGTCEWYSHGERHRLDGPAIVWDDGTREWYVRGKRVSPREIFPQGGLVNAILSPLFECEEDEATCVRTGYRVQVDGDGPFRLHYTEVLPANELYPAEYKLESVETPKGYLELWRGSDPSEPGAEFLRHILREMGAGAEYNSEDPATCIIAVERALLSEFRSLAVEVLT